MRSAVIKLRLYLAQHAPSAFILPHRSACTSLSSRAFAVHAVHAVKIIANNAVSQGRVRRDMADDSRATEQQTYPKTHAKELYCLGDKDLEPLPAKEKRNPYVSRGTPMKLYKQCDLEEAAVKRWGSLEEMETEKQKRVAKKEKRELEKARSSDKDGEEAMLGEEEGGPLAASQQAAVVSGGQLHQLVQERIHKVRVAGGGGDGGKASGDFVLYWMRTAVRDHDNPALDVARAEAERRSLPLVCASAVMGKSHTHPTHRRFKFLLEGLRDVQASFEDKGVPMLVYVEGISEHKDKQLAPGWHALVAAAAKAAIVITELMPTPPYTQNLKDMVQQLPRTVDVWAVDTACVVPVTLTKRPYAKAYAYRNSTAKLRKERLEGLPYAGQAVSGLDQDASRAVALVPWESVDLASVTDIPALLRAASAFDGSVPGVDHMIGGQVAGYARWDAFRKTGLSQYAARRNNPMLRSGVSRMSAYHHFGMVSPFRVAREAAAASNSGARKFADEFMTWREVAYCFCHHNEDVLETLEALPSWAAKTLKAHSDDPRDLKSLEQLEQGTTGDKIWDALQHQLNVTGELHNNVRMTWGKALLRWTPDPETALQQTCHLNHKFALDGCDPSSYGGILWCFGQFDGPKGAESTPVMGSLRDRPTQWLTRKLDPERFRNLPLDATTAQLAGAAAAAGGSNDIRGLFARAGHQADDSEGTGDRDPPDSDRENAGARADKTPASAPSRPTAEKSTAKKRKEANQPGIQQFFKRAKA